MGRLPKTYVNNVERDPERHLTQIYMEQVGKVPLLTREKERETAESMRDHAAFYIKLAVANPEIQEKFYGEILKLTKSRKSVDTGFCRQYPNIKRLKELVDETYAPEERKLLDKCYSRYLEARDLLASSNLRLVVSIAKNYTGRGLAFLDLIEEGNNGLLKSLDKYRVEKGFKLSTYASWWIKQSLNRALQNKATTVHIPSYLQPEIALQKRLEQEGKTIEDELLLHRVKAAMGIKMLNIDHIVDEDGERMEVEDSRTESPIEGAERNGAAERIEKILGMLSYQQAEILRMRYGIGRDEEMTLEEIGKEFRLSRERIRQIEFESLRKLEAVLDEKARERKQEVEHYTTRKRENRKSLGIKHDTKRKLPFAQSA